MNLERDPRTGQPPLPDPLPDDERQLLVLVRQFFEHARLAVGASAPDFDHGMAGVSLIKAKLDLISHDKLTSATNGLKLATWFLFGATVVLAGVSVALAWVTWEVVHRGHP